MAKLILFGGGDGGGIRITGNGVEPIPPFDPALRLQLKALNLLLRAGTLMPAKRQAQLTTNVISRLSSSVLGVLEAQIGAIDADQGLVYQDDEGGFSCGSTGKPPVPFPWPVDPRKTVASLAARGHIDGPTLAFLQRAAESKLDVFAVARDPRGAAKKLGAPLTPEVENALSAFNPDKVKVEDPVDREVISFYEKVVHDGRFISDWVVDPRIVAERLKLKVSAPAIDRIVATRDFGLLSSGGAVMSPAAVAVVVVIVIVLWSRDAEALPVIDRSGLQKF